MLGSVVWWCFSCGCCSVTYFCLTGQTALLSEECDIFEKRLTCCFNFAPQRRMVYLFWRRRLWTPPTLRRPSRPFWQVRSAFLTFGGINTPAHVSTFIRRSSQWGMSSVTKATASLTWQHSLHLLRKWSTVQFLLKVFLLSKLRGFYEADHSERKVSCWMSRPVRCCLKDLSHRSGKPSVITSEMTNRGDKTLPARAAWDGINRLTWYSQ